MSRCRNSGMAAAPWEPAGASPINYITGTRPGSTVVLKYHQTSLNESVVTGTPTHSAGR